MLRTFDLSPSEGALAVQIFGADPKIMGEAAKLLADLGAPLIDINMGCWVPKVVKKGGGAALLENLCQAAEVVKSVCASVQIPVTVKVRSGVRAGERTAVTFAKAAQEEGVAAISVHGRFAQQGFQGKADWSVIGEVVRAVKIPVFGNGDLVEWSDALRMQRETGCRGWMVGRAALAAPWLFRFWQEGRPLDSTSLEFRAAVARRHVELTQQYTPLPELQAVRELRGQLASYQLGDRQLLFSAVSFRSLHAWLAPLCHNLSWREWLRP